MSEPIRAETVLDALQHCCAEESDRRKSLEKPFRDGEYILGTNGRIAVRYNIPKEDYSKFPEEVEGHPSTAKVFPGYDNAVEFSAESIKELKDRYADWCKLIQNGIEKNPDDLEELTCPCCQSRLYRKSYGELIDADEYDEDADRLHGIVLRMQDGSQFFLRAYTLSKFLHFISVLGYNDIPTLYVRPYGEHCAHLLSKDGCWEAIMMLSWYEDNDKDIDCKPIGKVFVKGARSE